MRVVRGTLVAVEVVPYSDRVAPRAWVRADDGVLPLVDAAYEPYFWVLPAPGVAAADLAAALEALEAKGARPKRTEVARRRLGLAELDVVRVVLHSAADAAGLASAARKRDDVADALEADLPLHARWLLDLDLAVGNEVEGEASGGLVRNLRATGEPGAPPVVAALAVDSKEPRGAPGAHGNPIVRAALATADGVRAFAADGDDDRALLRDLVRALRDADPDVVLTFDGDDRDWPALEGRAELAGPAGGGGFADEESARLPLGRDRTGLQARSAGAGRYAGLAGRALVDLLRVAARDVPDVKLLTLANVLRHLGCGDDAVADAEGDATRRARAVLRLGESLLPLQAEIARLSHLPLDEAARAGRGRQVDQVLLAAAARAGILAPNRGQARGPEVDEEGGVAYEGGLVLEPRAGLHEDVVALDFRSMYPSLMIAHNVSPETVVPAGRPAPADAAAAPEVGHRVLREPRGFFAAIVEDLVRRRREAKAAMAAARPGSAERHALDTRQLALKVLTNATYGYLGWTLARWGSRDAAEAVTAWGRATIRGAVARARELGLEVLYGDTDSVLLRDGPAVETLVRETSRPPVELEVQERFARLLLTSAKKRYAGLARDGTVVVRGLEVRRGDWCALARRVQEETLERVLREGDPAAAAARVRDVVRDLREGRVPTGDLVIHKKLTMSPKRYRARAAHLAAVERAQREAPGFRVPVGAKVGYVVLKGPRAAGAGRLASRDATAEEDDAALVSGRTKLVEFLAPGDEPDVDYYVDKQVLPAALRILEQFGWSEAELKGAPRQTKLF